MRYASSGKPVDYTKYYEAYDLMLKRGYLLTSELSELIGIKSVASIKATFETIGLFTYDDELTQEEAGNVDHRRTNVIRALNPIHDKWKKEAREKVPKNGRIITNQRSIL